MVVSDVAGASRAGEAAPVSSSLPSSDNCLAHLNALRAKHGLQAMVLETSKSACVKGQARTDSAANSPHKAFGECGENGQCEAMGQRSCEAAIDAYYSEGPGGGHYEIIMGRYSSMAYAHVEYSGQYGTWWTHDFFNGLAASGNSTMVVSDVAGASRAGEAAPVSS